MALDEFDLSRPVRRDIASRPAHWEKYPKHLSRVEIRLALCRLDVTQFHPIVHGIVIGENPGPNTHPDLPLFPDPPTSSAGRLLAMSGLKAGEYLGGLYRRNLVDHHEWSWSEARETARELLTALFDQPKNLRVVLCGLKVAKAFDAPGDFWDPFRLDTRQTAVVIPHPSGMNRLYNDRVNRNLTGRWMRWAALGEDQP